MSDRTHVSLTICDCPSDQARAVLDVIERFGLHPEYDEPDAPQDSVLALRLNYMDHEIVCGSAQEISTMLQEVAPGASFEVFEDPFDSYLGTVYRFTPGLGLWSADCCAGGDPVFDVEMVRTLMNQNASKVETYEQALGIAHDKALTTLLAYAVEREQPAGEYVLITALPDERDWRQAVAAGQTKLSLTEWLAEQSPGTQDQR